MKSMGVANGDMESVDISAGSCSGLHGAFSTTASVVALTMKVD